MLDDAIAWACANPLWAVGVLIAICAPVALLCAPGLRGRLREHPRC